MALSLAVMPKFSPSPSSPSSPSPSSLISSIFLILKPVFCTLTQQPIAM